MGASHTISHILKDHTVNDVLESTVYKISPTASLEYTDTIATALETFRKFSVYTLPVRSDEYKTDFGFVSMLDIAYFMVNRLRKTTSVTESGKLPDELSEEFRVAFFATPISEIMDFSSRDPILTVEKTEKLENVAETMMTKKVFRLAVVSSASEVGSLATILTQLALLEYIHNKLAKAHKKITATLSELSMGVRSMITISEGMKTLDAFELLAKNKISSLPVVNSSSKMISWISAEWLRGLSPKDFDKLLLPLQEFYLLDSHEKAREQLTYASCAPTTSLRVVIETMIKKKVHRIFILDGGVPVGVVTVGDVIGQFYAISRTGDEKSLKLEKDK